ncbi:hypothetical protein CLOM_g17289 [Closterium sp. NIES-68]|nr:hypothetical protein CLOM_g17289 [Closterium sp. NIES-68]GJP79106.1 hypothetical protein CLOP_g9348 [Closterium sp. NIES-67]
MSGGAGKSHKFGLATRTSKWTAMRHANTRQAVHDGVHRRLSLPCWFVRKPCDADWLVSGALLENAVRWQRQHCVGSSPWSLLSRKSSTPGQIDGADSSI